MWDKQTIFFALIIVLIVFNLFSKFVSRKLKDIKKFRKNYSLGLKSAEQIAFLLKDKNYTDAEQFIQSQDKNDITHIVDHLALFLDEQELIEWKESSSSDIANLVLGVFYLHMAWIIRGHQTADNVSEENIENFFENLNTCEKTFNQILEDSVFEPELNSFKIRLHTSLEENSLAQEAFEKVSNSHPDLVWPYLHYAELIQPKWGGSLEAIESFYEELPDNFLISSIVQLKLALDSLISEENYFKQRTDDIRDFARSIVAAVDANIVFDKADSVHYYVLYNYMETLSEMLNMKDLQKKYEKLVDGNYTIYPCGLL